MNQTETKIYQKYRHVLTAQSRHGSQLFAPQKRQNARVAIVNEFNIPFAEVKRIVAAGDLISGITHEKPVQPVSKYDELTIKRVAYADLQVGDRVVGGFGLDARIIKIEDGKITFRGISGKGDTSHEWTSLDVHEIEDFPVAVEKPRK